MCERNPPQSDAIDLYAWPKTFMLPAFETAPPDVNRESQCSFHRMVVLNLLKAWEGQTVSPDLTRILLF